jgi:hypothetical protein
VLYQLIPHCYLPGYQKLFSPFHKVNEFHIIGVLDKMAGIPCCLWGDGKVVCAVVLSQNMYGEVHGIMGDHDFSKGERAVA